MSNSISPVLSEKVGKIITITLNRPKRLNAIDSELIEGLHGALERAVDADDVRAIILTGAGKRAFCVGDDLKVLLPQAPDEALRQVTQMQDITRLIVYSPKPVIAAVNGWAVGGGFEWAMNCDLSLWADTAKAFLPEVSLGLGVTGAATAILPRIVGWQRARALLLLGDRLDARQLHNLGLAYEVTSLDTLLDRAQFLAHRIANMPTSSVAGLKRIMAVVGRVELEAALEAEADLLVTLMEDEATAIRLAKFWERRS